MANEATLVVETGKPINFTVADGTGIEKGAILALSDPMTAAGSTQKTDYPAGIAAAEKIASDGVTKLAVYREGIFKLTASGTIVLGEAVRPSGTVNKVEATGVNGENVLAISLESATNGETFLAELRPTHMLLA